MLCGHCGDPVSPPQDKTCTACGESPLLEGRYRLEDVVGQGANGITYRATRLSDGQSVAIKELPFRRIDSIKTKALFQREASVLRQLEHAGIPAYLDDFTAGSGKHLSLYLVQEFIDGQTLTEEMVDRRYQEAEVLEIADSLLDVLVYLHGLSPAVIHRDIKPRNVMRRGGDGSLVLVDFGSVLAAVQDPSMGGSTIAGTFGFMAPEQFQGKATAATDLFGLGALMITLLTRRAPDTLMGTNNRLEWEPFVEVHPKTRALLRRLLEPDPDVRVASARTVRKDIAEILDIMTRPAPLPPRNAPPQLNAPPEPFEWKPTSDTGLDGPNSPFGEASIVPLEIERPPDSSGSNGTLAVVLGAGMLATLVIGLAFVSRTEVKDVSLTAKSNAVSTQNLCDGKACEPVPRGLKGLSFGATVPESTLALPEMGAATPASAETISPQMDVLNMDFSLMGMGEKLPGKALSVQTTLGSFPATCVLRFAVDDTLSKMVCDLSFASSETHRAAEQKLLDTLQSRYGVAMDSRLPQDNRIMGYEHNAEWRWNDQGARLELVSHYKSYGGNFGIKLEDESKITLTNVSSEHDTLIRKIRMRLNKAIEAKKAEKARKSAEKQLREREALEKGSEGLKDDL